jgi:2-oxo-hept-3-ene-1,7-dioate hydratase
MLPEKDRQAAADSLLNAEKTRVVIAQLSKTYPDMTIDDAYDVQRRWEAARVTAGAHVVGRKIGLTSRAMQQASKMTEPDCGVILDDRLYRDGASIPAKTFIKPRLETELAFITATDLSGTGR